MRAHRPGPMNRRTARALNALTASIVSMPAAARPELLVLSDPARARTLLDPERRRLVEALAEEPDSAAGLARRLGEKRQRLNYHLRQLEHAGLVELVEARPAGGLSERVLRLVARRFVVDPAAAGGVGATDPAEVGDRFSATYLVAMAARGVRELAALMERAGRRRERLATGSVNTQVRLAAPADFEVFMADLTRAVGEVVARHHASDGRWFRVLAGSYPGPAPGDNGQGVNDG